MTIVKKATLAAYGKFRGRSISFGTGLNVVYGPNEAGKTTTQTFLYQMLTGFPTRHNKDRVRYFPDGGDPEGVLILEDSAGEHIVERRWRETTVRGSSLDDLLHGVDADLLNGVYSIHLTDLQELGVLNEDAQRDKVFSAGVMGAGPSARQVVSLLDERAEALGGASKRKSRILDLTSEMMTLETELIDARERMANFPELQGQHEVVDRSLHNLLEREKSLRRECDAFRLRVDLQPVYNCFEGAVRELETLPEVRVSQPALDRAEHVNTDLARLERDRVRLEADCSRLSTQLGQVVRGEHLWVQADAIERVNLEVGGFREKQKSIEICRRDLESLSNELEEAARKLGDLSIEEATALKLDIVFETELDTFAQRLPQLEERVREAQKNEGALRRQRDGAQQDLEAAPSAEELPPVDDRDHHLELLEGLVDEKHREEGARAGVSEVRSLPPGWFVTGLLALMLLASIVAFVAGSVGTGVALLLCTIALAAGLKWLWADVSKRASERRAKLEAIDRRATELAEKGAPFCDALGLQWPPSRADLRTVRREVEKQRSAAELAKASAGARERAVERLRLAEVQLETSSADLRAARAELLQAQDSWTSWLQDRGLPEGTPQVVKRLIERVVEVQRHVRSRSQVAERLSLLDEEASNWAAAARKIVSAAGVQVEEDVTVAISMAVRKLAEEREIRREARELEEDLTRGGQLLVEAQSHEAKLRLERDELLETHGASDLEELREQRTVTERAEQLDAEISEHKRTLTRRLGTGSEADAVIADLKEGNESRWHHGLDEVEQRLEALTAERDELIAERTGLKRDLDELRDSTRIPELEFRFETLRTELVDACETWRRHVVARELIAKALERYRKERQPDVLRHATAIFSQVTGEKYDQVILDDETNQIVIRRSDTGAGTELIRLSSGTSQPLYLAMRMGLISEFAQKRGPIPVLMDDILVNLDETRHAEMAREIATFAEQQQVIFFTCHARVRDEFARLTDANIINLDDGDQVAVRGAA